MDSVCHIGPKGSESLDRTSIFALDESQCRDSNGNSASGTGLPWPMHLPRDSAQEGGSLEA